MLACNLRTGRIIIIFSRHLMKMSWLLCQFYGIITANGMCYFRQLNGIWGAPPPKISETTEPMTMKLLPDFKLNKEARNQENNLHDLTGL